MKNRSHKSINGSWQNATTWKWEISVFQAQLDYTTILMQIANATVINYA